MFGPGIGFGCAGRTCGSFVGLDGNGVAAGSFFVNGSVCADDGNGFAFFVYDGSRIVKGSNGAVSGYRPGGIRAYVYVTVARTSVTGIGFVLYKGALQCAAVCHVEI